jgi:hypothetical protein
MHKFSGAKFKTPNPKVALAAVGTGGALRLKNHSVGVHYHYSRAIAAPQRPGIQPTNLGAIGIGAEDIGSLPPQRRGLARPSVKKLANGIDHGLPLFRGYAGKPAGGIEPGKSFDPGARGIATMFDGRSVFFAEPCGGTLLSVVTVINRVTD